MSLIKNTELALAQSEIMNYCQFQHEIDAINKIIYNETKNCENELHKDIVELELLTSALNYKPIVDLLYTPYKDTIIIDLGCGAGIQQILFRDFAGYIGIDWRELTPIIKDFHMIEGDMREVIPMIMRNKKKYGLEDYDDEDYPTKQVVAVSLYCCSAPIFDCLDVIKKYFNRIITI